MNRGLLITICALALLPLSAKAGDGIDLKQWNELKAIAHQRDVEYAGELVPTHMNPTTSKENVFQQVLEYHLHRAGKANPVKIADTKWASDQAPSDASTTFEVKPFQTRATMNYHQIFNATLSYHPWAQETVLELAPVKKVGPFTLGFSHTTNGTDQTERFLVGFDW